MTLLCERRAESADLGSKELWRAVGNRKRTSFSSFIFFVFGKSEYSKEYLDYANNSIFLGPITVEFEEL